MGSLSDDDANNTLDVRFGGATSSAPASYWAGLSTTEPASDGSGVTEPTDTAYGRVEVVNNDTNFPDAVARSKSTGTAITFPAPLADWGDIGWYVFFDDETAGALRAWGEFATPTTVLGGGAAPVIPAGGIVITAP